MSRNRVWVLVSLVCALVGVPAQAYASDGFLGGLEDLTGTRDVAQQVEYERDYQDEYVPDTSEVVNQPVRALPEDATTVDYVNDTLDKFNRIPGSFGATNTWIESLRLFLGGRVGANVPTFYLVPAVGVVFMWWGVRKAKNMVMSAFKRGKISI